MSQDKQISYFLEHPIIGKVKIIKVFVFYDIPRTFVCENEIGTKYIFSELDEDDDITKWLVVPISSYKYSLLLRNKLYLRESLIHSESNSYISLTLNFKTNEVNYSFLPECPVDDIIQSDFYVGSSEERVDDLHGIVETAAKEGSPQLDLIVDDIKDSLPGLDAVSFCEIGDKTRLLLSSLYGRPVNPLISTLTGSFVIRLNIIEPTNIFDGQDSIECIDTFNRIIKENDPDNIYSLLRNNRKSAARYREFLNSLSRINKNIKVVTATPYSQEPVILPLEQATITNRKDAIDKLLESTQTKEYDLFGILTEFNSINPSFQIVDNNGKTIKGTYDSSVYNSDSIYGVNSRVKASIVETVFLNKDGSVAKKKPVYLLKKLEFIK